MKIKLILFNILRPALSFQYLSPTPSHLPFFWGIKNGTWRKMGCPTFTGSLLSLSSPHWNLSKSDGCPVLKKKSFAMHFPYFFPSVCNARQPWRALSRITELPCWPAFRDDLMEQSWPPALGWHRRKQ